MLAEVKWLHGQYDVVIIPIHKKSTVFGNTANLGIFYFACVEAFRIPRQIIKSTT